MSSKESSAGGTPDDDSRQRQPAIGGQKIRAWVDDLAGTSLDLDLVSVINDVLTGWSTPRAKWSTMGGYLTYLLASSTAVICVTFFNVLLQPCFLWSFPLLEEQVEYLRQLEASRILLEGMHGLLSGLAEFRVFRLIGLVFLGFAASLIAIDCAKTLFGASEVLYSGLTWRDLQRVKWEQSSVRRLLIDVLLMIIVQASYHFVNDNYFMDERLPSLREGGLRNPTLQLWSTFGWCALFVFLLSSVFFHRRLYEKRREVDPKPAPGTVALLIFVIAMVCVVIVILLFCYVLDFFEEEKVDSPVEEAGWQVARLFVLNFILTPNLSLLYLWVFHTEEIHSEDLKALRLVLDGAGFQQKEIPIAIRERVTVNRGGRVIKILLHRCQAVKRLPVAIGSLSKLEELSLEACENLEELPPEIGNCEYLTKLLLEGCKQLKVPFSKYASNDGKAIPFMKRLLRFRGKKWADLGQNDTLPVWLEEGGEPDPDDNELLYTAAIVEACSTAFEEACKLNKNLVTTLDHLGRRLIDVACPPCRNAMREASLFYKLYKFNLETDLKYKSTTSIVYFARKFSQDDSTEVALKFMYNKKDLDSEWEARLLKPEADKPEADNQRFEDEFVIPIFDKHCDKDFRTEAKNNKLPGFCLVLLRGERNLLEQVNAFSGDMTHLRQVGKRLADCLAHIHSKGYIHGDFKPKNIVWGTNWKLIDFDAAVLANEEGTLGRKLSTAYAPPELIKDRPGKVPRVRSPDRYKHTPALSTEGNFLPPSQKYDVWSYGAVLFHLIVGTPLFGNSSGTPLFGNSSGTLLFGNSSGEGDATVTSNMVQDNLDLVQLKDLADWENIKDEKLAQVAAKSLSAKQLLEEILHSDPEQRPSMRDVLRHHFFQIDNLEKDWVAEKENIQKEMEALQQKLEVAETVEIIQQQIEELEQMREQRLDGVIRQWVSEQNAANQAHGKRIMELDQLVEDGFHDTIQYFRALDTNIAGLSRQISDLRTALHYYHEETTNMLRTVIENDLAPTYVLMLPEVSNEQEKWWATLKRWGNPAGWLNRPVRVYCK